MNSLCLGCGKYISLSASDLNVTRKQCVNPLDNPSSPVSLVKLTVNVSDMQNSTDSQPSKMGGLTNLATAAISCAISF